MGYLNKYYSHIHNYNVNLRYQHKTTPGSQVVTLELNDARDISLAKYSPVAKSFLEMHEPEDYRQTNTSMILLPAITILFDKVLEGSDYYRELLSYGSFY